MKSKNHWNSLTLFMRAPQGGPGRKQFFIEKLAFFGRNTLLLCERCARHVQGRRKPEGLGDNPLKFGRKISKTYAISSWIPTCSSRFLNLPMVLYRVQQASKQARLLQQWWTNSIQSKWGVYWTAIHLFSRGLRLSCWSSTAEPLQTMRFQTFFS